MLNSSIIRPIFEVFLIIASMVCFFIGTWKMGLVSDPAIQLVHGGEYEEPVRVNLKTIFLFMFGRCHILPMSRYQLGIRRDKFQNAFRWVIWGALFQVLLATIAISEKLIFIKERFL